MVRTSLGRSSRAMTGFRSSSPRLSELASLALPWFGLIVSAIIAVYWTNDRDDHAQAHVAMDRLLTEHAPIIREDHKPLFPLDMTDHYGFVLATLGLMIAAGGGIGGGGILVPIYCLVMGFSPKHAIPLSNVTVFGGAIANTISNVKKRHPNANRPLVDWDLILIMEPLTIAGALIGAFLNKVLPEQLLTFLLVLLLSFTAYTSLEKAIKMYRKETRAMRAAGLRADGTKASELTIMAEKQEEDEEEATEKLIDKDAEEEKEPDEDEHLKEVDLQEAARQAELEQILKEESVTPVINLKILGALFIVVLAMNLLKGGGAFRSPLGIRCGSTGFWAANGLILGWIIAITIYIRHYLVKRHETKLRCGYEFIEGDIKWDSRSTIVYPVICCAAGFFAGMFGIGGGIVKGPLMLAMNVHPAVASASSATMILFTSFTATSSYVVFGLLVPDYAFVCLVVGFAATMVGQAGLSYLMKNSNRNSYIVFSIGAVVLLSAILMTFQSLLAMAAGEQHHSGGICGKGD